MGENEKSTSNLDTLTFLLKSNVEETKKLIEKINDKELNVTMVLTESAASVLNLDLPHFDPETSNTINLSTDKSKTNIVSNKSSVVEEIGSKDSDCIDTDLAYVRDVDIEASSCSIVGEDDLSRKSFINTAPVFNTHFMPSVVMFSPIGIVRTFAHQNNLDCNKKSIVINVLPKEPVVTSSGWVNVCRICHGGESIGELVEPCRCRGSVALAHHCCLERWLRESLRSHCELCKHKYSIVRQPKYSFVKAVGLWLVHPGPHRREMVKDVAAFIMYTPVVAACTYILTSVAETTLMDKNCTASVGNGTTIVALLGITCIDIGYTAWLLEKVMKYVVMWQRWWRENCIFTLLLPKCKFPSNMDVVVETSDDIEMLNVD